ncbi:MAG: hypothetical protein KDJ38_00960 [Gammaproteobacteria bacterium]|nr:hypothetical protein [Gammaproteobacteria bacterium]
MLISLVLIGVEYRSYQLESAMNRAVLDSSGFDAALVDKSAFAQSLVAWKAYHDGDFDTAEKYYNTVLTFDDKSLVQNARFNLAEIYLRKAVALEESARSDARIPYIELAKENYRMILRADNSHWPSRYNLARVLQVLPDAEFREAQEDDIMPERSPSAPVETTAYERLP